MPGMREMSLDKAWRIFKKRRQYDSVHGQYALDRLVREIEAHMGGTVCSDIELIQLNGEWYGSWEDKMRPLCEVLAELADMKKPDGSVMRIRVSKPKEG